MYYNCNQIVQMCVICGKCNKMGIKIKVRLKAIFFAVKHGVLPTWVYERKPHHNFTYFEHLKYNLAYAWRWACNKQTECDVEFEREINQNF